MTVLMPRLFVRSLAQTRADCSSVRHVLQRVLPEHPQQEGEMREQIDRLRRVEDAIAVALAGQFGRREF